MKPHYKNTEEALKIERPGDKVVKILSNKFAIVKPAFEGGGFHIPCVMGISNNTTVYSFSNLDGVIRWLNDTEKMPNISKTFICYNFPENRRYAYWQLKVNDNRKYKQIARRLEKLLLPELWIKK